MIIFVSGNGIVALSVITKILQCADNFRNDYGLINMKVVLIIFLSVITDNK